MRDAARAAVLGRVRADYAVPFARNLPLVFRLRALGRDDHAALAESILGLLRSPGSRPALLDALDGTDRHGRRLAFGLLLDAGGDVADVMERGLAAADPVIRLRAAHVARERFEGSALAGALDRMFADRFVPVRREALYGYAERLPAAADAVLMTSLLDRHAGMREAARYYLRARGETDLRAFYRARLSGGGHDERVAAVAGLGETGGAEDVGHLRPLLADPDPHVRRAAVRALGRLDGDGHVDHFLTALDDPSAAVARAARDVLRPRLCLVPPARLRSLIAGGRPRARRVAVSLAAELVWWDSAPLLVAATGSDDEEVRRAAAGHLEGWRWNPRRLLARPCREQLVLLDEMIRENQDRLEPGSLNDLEARVAYARKERADAE